MARKKDKKSKGLHIYKRLVHYVLPYKGLFFISLLGYFVSSVTQPLFAELVKIIIDTLQSPDRKGAMQLPFYFSGLIIVRSLAVFIGSYFISRVSANMVHDLRSAIFKRYTQLPTSYFESNNSGYLISRITNNVQQVTAASTDSVRTLIREGMTAIGLMGYLFYINWQLSLIFLSIAPLIVVIVTVFCTRLRMLSKRLQESIGDLTQIASEVVGGYKVMKSYGGEAYENTRFQKQSRYHRNQTMKLAVTDALQNPIMQIIIAVALSVLMYFALLFMEHSTTGEFVAYLTAAFMLPRAFKFISGANASIQKGIAAAQSLFEVLDAPIENDIGQIEVDHCHGKIEFKHLSFRYEGSERDALKNINLTIEPGQTVALVGESGSGKTTLVNVLMRFYDLNEGEIRIDNINIQDIKLQALRKQMSLVTQHIVLFDDTVKNNIAYGDPDCDEQKVQQAAQDAYATGFIGRLENGMDTEIGEHGVKLSGGQCQRVAIARAIYKNAPILILDEATSALDTQSEKYIQFALENVRKNRTSIIIAHRLSTIENADVILVMQNGEIIESGSHQELLKTGKHYARLYELQFQTALEGTSANSAPITG